MADFAKKLTVSFGAFSCTLSGFDDPFPVMRQVVDYFQQLSQTDPSFGAHPERPDTEELRRIAEKTSGLTVGAEMHGDEVILSSAEEEDVEAFAEEPSVEQSVGVENTAEIDPSNETAVAHQPAAEEIQATTMLCETADDLDRGELGSGESVANADAPTEQPNQDAFFEQIDITDFDDEVFDNIDAEDIYAPTPLVANNTLPTEQPQVKETYAEEGVRFEDADTSTEDQPSETIAETPAVEANPLEVWEAEFEAEDPTTDLEVPAELDAVPFVEDNKVDDNDLSFDEHVAAEKKALERILAATKTTPELDPENPLTSVAQEIATPNTAPDQRELPTQTNYANETMTLGFGNEVSLDATRDISSDTVDVRAKPDPAKAMAAMGVFGEESDEDFDWEAELPTETSHKADTQPETEVAPLLLTPSDQVAQPTEPAISGATVDFNQEDPRDDLRKFASATGAASLTELLDASAAYSTLVRGRPSFSRGEVLDLLDQFSDEDGFSQEARIKTFGSLLRGGRIQPIDNGKYEMTNDALSEYQAKRTG